MKQPQLPKHLSFLPVSPLALFSRCKPALAGIGLVLMLIAFAASDADAQCYGSGWGTGIYYGTGVNNCTPQTSSVASTQYQQWDGIAGYNYNFELTGGWASSSIYWTYFEVVGGVWTAIYNGNGQTANVTALRTSPAGNGWNLIVFYYDAGCPPTWPGTSATMTYKVTSYTSPSISAPANITTNVSPANGCAAAQVFGNATGSPSCSGTQLGTSFNLMAGPLASLAGNLKLWCRADEGIAKDVSGNVENWFDMSGNGNWFRQFSQGNRPSYTASSASFNGQPCVTFNTSQYLTLVNSLDGGAQSNYTMFVVDRLSGTNSRLCSSASTNWLFGNWGGGEEKMYCNNWISSSASTPSGDAIPHMYEVTSNSNVGSGTNFYDYGVLQATGTGGAPNGPGQIQLNGYSNGLNEMSSGDVAEVIYFNTILSAAQRQIVEGYLAYKYNLPCPLASAKAFQNFTTSTTYGFIAADDAGKTAATTATASVSSYPGPAAINITNPANCAGASTTSLSVVGGMAPAGSCLTTGTNTSNYLLVGTSGTTSNVTLGANWTIGSWVKFPLPATGNWNTLFRGISYHPVIVNRTQGATNAGLILGAYQGGFYPASAASVVNGGTIAGVAANTQSVDISALSAGWHHIATVGTGNTESFYIDGIFVGKSAIQVGYSASDNLIAIGNYQGGGQDAGTMDEVKIYNAALSQNAISNMMTVVSNSSTDPNWNNLVAYYKMDASPVPNSATGPAACTSCNGTVQNSATAGSTATAYYTYNWSGPGSPSFSPAASTTSESVTINSITTGNAGTYSVYASANGCNSTTVTSGAITVSTPSTAPTGISGTTTLCNGTGTTLTATGGSLGTGANYQWGTGSTVGTSPIGGATASTYSVTPSSTTSYWVSVTGPAPCGSPAGGATTTVTVYNLQTMSLTSGSASPTLCKSTALGTNTVYTFGGGATSASITAGALPAGMTGTVVGSTFVIAGTPSVAGSFAYTVTSSGAGGCSPVSLGGTITVNDVQSMSLTGGSASPTLCKSTALGTNTVYTFGGGATSASITAGVLPAGMTGTVVGSTFVIAGTPSVAGSFPYTVTSSGAGSCSPVSLGGTITVNNTQSMSLTGGSASPTLCKSTTLGTNTVYTFGGGATSASITAGTLPAGMTGTVVGSTFVIAGTPSVSGSFPYTVTTSGAGSCSPVSLGGTITVNDVQTMSLTGGSASPTLCKSTTLGTNTVYTFGGGATSASITAGVLPAGMTGTVVGSTFVIAGTPSVAGSFSYTVTTSGAGSCSPVSLGGTITVNNTQTMTLTGGSASPTLCKSSALGTNTVYTFGGGATSASITAGVLPAGMTGTVVGSTFVIAGTPSVAGSFSYTVTSSGAGSCSPVSLGGTITVNDIQTMTLTGGSASPTICQNTTLATNTVYTFGGGATSASITAGTLPAGMTGTVVGSTFVIAGTPSASGSFPYTVTSSGTGGCSPVALGGTITVNATPTPTLSVSGLSCTGASVTYSTQTSQSSYVWTLSGTPGTDYTITSGGTSTDDNVVVSYITSGSKTVTVNYSNGSGCPGLTAASDTRTIGAAPDSASIYDIIDGCNGGHTAVVTVTGGAAPYDYTLCGTPMTGQPASYTMSAGSSSSCSLTSVTDANGCPAITIIGSPVIYPARALTTGDTYACVVGTGAVKVFYDNSGNLMVKITDGGGTLGSTTVVASVDGSVQQFGPTNPQSYLQRHFKISPANTSGSATVCLYLSDAEVSALNIASATNDNHGAPSYYQTFDTGLVRAVVTKFHGAGETPVSNVSRQVLTPTSKTHNPTVNGVTYNNVWEMCMTVSSWSGFYVHAQNTNNTPLPVTMLYLTADAIDNKYIQLDWATASEINNSGFQIERSTNGTDFMPLGWVAGNGTSNSEISYLYEDRTAQPGIVYYYRLKQVDIDGHFEYTEIVSASLIGDRGFVFEDLIPNPAVNSVQIGILSTTGQKATISITDMLGRIVFDQPWQLAEGYNTSIYDVSGLAGGAYNVTISSGTTHTTKRLVVTK